MAGLAGDQLGDHDALFHALVRQHRAAHDVAHRPDVGQVAAAVVVDVDAAALVELEADGLAAKPFGVRHAADGDDELVAFEHMALIAGVVFDGDALLAGGYLVDLHAEADVEALLFREHLPGFPGDGGIGGGEEFRQGFEDRDLGAEALPDAAQLEADDAGADDAEALRHGVEGERAGVVANQLVVDGNAVEVARARAGGDDDVLRHHHFAGDVHFPAVLAAAGELAVAGQQRDLVLLEQALDAAGELGDDVVLALDHGPDVDPDVVDGDAVHDEAVAGIVEVLGGLQQRLGGNAADVEAGAAEAHLALRVVVGLGFAAGGAEAELRGADGGDVAAGAAADDEHVELFGHLRSPAAGAPGPPALPSW